MTNYVKTYRKTDIIKAYDLLELKDNGKIDADGDYLDDEGEKLTHHKIGIYSKTIYDNPEIYLPTMRARADKVYVDGFIYIGENGDKWYVSRDEFLAAYEEMKNDR